MQIINTEFFDCSKYGWLTKGKWRIVYRIACRIVKVLIRRRTRSEEQRNRGTAEQQNSGTDKQEMSQFQVLLFY